MNVPGNQQFGVFLDLPIYLAPLNVPASQSGAAAPLPYTCVLSFLPGAHLPSSRFNKQTLA